MPSAEIIAIGSELLLGETLDTNTQYLLREFRKLGIDVFRTMIIGDNPGRIAEAIRDACSRADIVITTGGLGPTVDDPTRSAVSKAFDCEPVFREELWQDILRYYEKMGRCPTENNKVQAYLPEIAEPILNPVGTAPAFYIRKNENLVVSLPGVPREMKFLFSTRVVPLFYRFYPDTGCILMRNLHSFGIGESMIDELVGELESSANPSLGLCAKQGQIDLRITAKGKNEAEACAMADEFEAIIRERLGNAVFGKDDDTLFSVITDLLRETGMKLRVIENDAEKMFCGVFDEAFVSSSETLPLEYSFDTAEEFLSENNDKTISVFYSRKPGDNGFTCIRTVVQSSRGRIDESRNYNPLTFDDNDYLLFALNVLRLSLLELHQNEERL